MEEMEDYVQSQEPTEPGLEERLRAAAPDPGSYWATHEIVRRRPDEMRNGEAPAYVRRIG